MLTQILPGLFSNNIHSASFVKSGKKKIKNLNSKRHLGANGLDNELWICENKSIATVYIHLDSLLAICLSSWPVFYLLLLYLLKFLTLMTFQFLFKNILPTFHQAVIKLPRNHISDIYFSEKTFLWSTIVSSSTQFPQFLVCILMWNLPALLASAEVFMYSFTSSSEEMSYDLKEE